MAQQSQKQKAVNGREITNISERGAGAQGLLSWFSNDWFFGLILVLAVILAYQPVWHAGYIWDDDGHVTRMDLRSWAGLGRIWFVLGATQQYYPFVHSIFWVEHGLWGDMPLGYHLVNVLLHAFSSLLLLAILRRLEVPGAWLAVAIFALHPVQVESVAWISELKNVLSGVFYFGSALVYLKFDRTRKTGVYGAALVLFVLGLLSKTVIATLPAALLVVFWWKREKLSWKQDVLPLVPFFIAGIASGLVTAWVEQHFIGAKGVDFNYTIIQRALIAGRAIWFYMGKIVWPSDLIFIYPHWNVNEAVWWQYLFPVAALILAAALGWLSWRWRGPLAGFLFFVGTLFPALGFLNVYPFRYSFVADHFQYLACLGIIVPFAAGMTRFADSVIPKKPCLQSSLCAGLLLILGILSWYRAWVYENTETLWIDTLARDPNCWMAHINLGNALVKKGQPTKAMAYYHKALEINPNLAKAHYGLGDVLLQKGQVDEAIAEYQRALEINPDFVEAHSNLGVALLQRGQMDEAIVEYQRALEINPYYANAHINFGNALLQNGQMDEAIAQYRKALEINPDFVEAHSNLGVTLFRKGQVDEAIAEYQRALEINPNNARSHNNLGLALVQEGRVDEAIAEYQRALEINPNYTNAQDNLAKAKAVPAQKAVQNN